MFQCTRSMLLFALAICFANSPTTRAADIAATRPAVVVELFTSEGCSSCPPADAVLADLAKPGAVDGVQVIPLEMHVDYWNALGWADPFSSPQFSSRQQQYARIFKTDEIYTPQMVVDGMEQFVGSDKQHAIDAIIKSAAQSKGSIAISVRHDPTNGNSLTCEISINNIHRIGDSMADVLLAVTEDDLSTDVRRGENAGRSLRHAAVVRVLRQVATIAPADALPSSASTIIRLQPTWRANHLHVAVFVQNPTTGEILAAASQRLPGPKDKN